MFGQAVPSTATTNIFVFLRQTYEFSALLSAIRHTRFVSFFPFDERFPLVWHNAEWTQARGSAKWPSSGRRRQESGEEAGNGARTNSKLQ